MALETRITHVVGEVLRTGDPKARITHTVGEVLRTGDPKARITHAVMEVLRDSGYNPTNVDGNFFLVL